MNQIFMTDTDTFIVTLGWVTGTYWHRNRYERFTHGNDWLDAILVKIKI